MVNNFHVSECESSSQVCQYDSDLNTVSVLADGLKYLIFVKSKLLCHMRVNLIIETAILMCNCFKTLDLIRLL